MGPAPHRTGLQKPVRYPGWIDSLASKLAFFPPDPPSYALRAALAPGGQPTIIPTQPGLPLVRSPMTVARLAVGKGSGGGSGGKDAGVGGGGGGGGGGGPTTDDPAAAAAQQQPFIVAAHLPPARPPPPPTTRPTLLLFAHGNAVDLGQMLPFLAELGPALGPGVGVACYDYRGYGASGGSPSAAGIVEDGAAVLEWAVSALGYAPEDIVLYGQSVGSAPAAALAARWRAPGDGALAAAAARLPPGAWEEGGGGGKEKEGGGAAASLLPSLGRVGALALHSPLASGVRVLRPTWTWWPPALDVFPNAAHVREVHAPTLVLHGDADEVVSFQCGLDVHARARTPSTGGPLWVPGGGHCDLEASPGYVRRLRAFVAEARAHGAAVAGVRAAARKAVAGSGGGGGGKRAGCIGKCRK